MKHIKATILITLCALLFLGATVCNLRYFIWHTDRGDIGCHAIVPDAWPLDFGDVIPERTDINCQLVTLEYIIDKGQFGLIVHRSVPKVIAITYKLVDQERRWFLPDDGGYPHEIDELALIMFLNYKYYDELSGEPPFKRRGEDI